MTQSKKIILGIVLGFILIIGLFGAGKLYEDVDAGEIVIIQDPVDGEMHVNKQPGMVWQGWGKVTHYKKSGQLWFLTPKEKDEPDGSLPVKWNDGGHATISGSIRYDLPMDDEAMIRLHSTFGSQEAIESHLIKTNIEKAVYLVGPLMSSKESYAEKKNDLIYYIEDQASRGAYKTIQKEVKEMDQLTNTEKLVTKVEIEKDSLGVPARQEISPMSTYKVKLYNMSINNMIFSAEVEAQIKTQQQSIMSVQTSIANAKRAEQDAITTAKQGEADAAKAKWDQEVIKATQVTAAEAAKAVAVLELETARLNKQRDIEQGEGEAAKKRLAMQANGALEQKLAAYVQVQGFWADAFSKFQGNLVPTYQSGGGPATNATNWVELMGMKAMRDLSLDMNNKGN